jgi:hypothetical protein
VGFLAESLFVTVQRAVSIVDPIGGQPYVQLLPLHTEARSALISRSARNVQRRERGPGGARDGHTTAAEFGGTRPPALTVARDDGFMRRLRVCDTCRVELTSRD